MHHDEIGMLGGVWPSGVLLLCNYTITCSRSSAPTLISSCPISHRWSVQNRTNAGAFTITLAVSSIPLEGKRCKINILDATSSKIVI